MILPRLAMAAAIAAIGGVDVTVGPSKGDRTYAAWQRSVAALERPSPRTAETLRRYDLVDRHDRDPGNAIDQLEAYARRAPEPELVYALAELSWIEGRRLDRKRRQGALDRYLDTVAFAHDFLFDPEFAADRHPSDPRYRLAIDLYNGGLDRLMRGFQAGGKIEPGGTIPLKLHGKEEKVRVALWSGWAADDVDRLELASDYEVTGLPTSSRRYGLGVPLIALRDPDPEDDKEGERSFYPPGEMAFPLTAFLRPSSRLREERGDVEGAREVTLDLVDTVRYQTFGQGPGAVLLEADLTTPLATMWSRTNYHKAGISGLLRPGDSAHRNRLMLLRPYEPGKIPVVMVHGLASSPLAWIAMLNELQADPRIQNRYQFLLYVYPTGVPIPIAAAGLREELRRAKQQFDPDGSDPAFAQMVLLGHSMGGLLSHAMAVDSDDKLWVLNSDRAIDDILGPPEVLGELRRFLFFEAQPFVRRVVFLGTPHRGSELSRSTIGRLSSNLISEPDQISGLLSRLIRDNPDAFDRKAFRRLPTSIDTLDTDAPVLLALLAMRPSPSVTFHSIIGNTRPGPVAGATDGVVAYRSAHIDGVASERVVRSDHSVQQDPEAILEVRRILLEHIGVGPAAAIAAGEGDAAAVPR